MILYRGELHQDSELSALLGRLEGDCLAALAGEPITPELVVSACDSLARDIAQGQFDHLLSPFLEAFSIPRSQLDAALGLFTRESLIQKLRLELGEDPAAEDLPHPDCSHSPPSLPLGVLLHIAAGNVDGLPAYSVVEGLLAGNINLLKLPSMDHGASLLLLHELVERDPD